MEIRVYVTSVGLYTKKATVTHVACSDREGLPEEWAYAYSYDHTSEMTDDELKNLFEERQKTIVTPDQEIAELKAKLAKYECNEKGGFIWHECIS